MSWRYWSSPSGANGNHGGAGGKLGARSRTMMGTTGEDPERTASPAQTTVIYGVKMGFPGYAVDAGNPLQYEDFPLVRALS